MSAEVIELATEARAALRKRRAESPDADLFAVLDAVKDPEIPVLSIWDLGILQDVARVPDGVVVTITPTYSGCPAMETIAADIEHVLSQAGVDAVVVQRRLSPAWSSEWMDSAARKRLNAYGIAPPGTSRCPQCGSEDTELVSEFGSTSCKALLRCRSCQEPFDQFKRI